MNLLKILKTLGKGAVKAGDVATEVIPALKPIDIAKDALVAISRRSTKADILEKVNTATEALQQFDPKAFQLNRGKLEYKRLTAAIVNGIAVGIIYIGFDPAVADQIAMYVTAPIVAYIAGDTIRPSKVS